MTNTLLAGNSAAAAASDIATDSIGITTGDYDLTSDGSAPEPRPGRRTPKTQAPGYN